MRYLNVITLLIIIILVNPIYISTISDFYLNSENRKPIILVSNHMLENITYYGDKFSDKNGKRAFPWGFEIWQGDPLVYFEVSEEKHSGNYSAKIIGNSEDDMAVIAVPDYEDKPIIEINRTYRLEAWVKLVNVKGEGVRLMIQWFNYSEIYYPEYFIYGKFYRGNSSWMKIYIEGKPTTPTIVKGDPIVQLWGSGTVYVDDIIFYEMSDDIREVELSPLVSNYNDGEDYTARIRYWDGNYIWMGPNTWVNVTKWDLAIKDDEHMFITEVKAYCGISMSYNGTLIFWTNYTGDIDFCKYNITNIENMNLTCDLYSAGIDTVEEVNNLKLACKFNQNSNANLEVIRLMVKYSYDP